MKKTVTLSIKGGSAKKLLANKLKEFSDKKNKKSDPEEPRITKDTDNPSE